MLKKLIDGFPMYVPHNRLILISDINKKVFEIKLYSKKITNMPDRPSKSSGFSLQYDRGDRFIYFTGGFEKQKALKSCYKMNIFTLKYTTLSDLN
jgi:hypothetical protein